MTKRQAMTMLTGTEILEHNAICSKLQSLGAGESLVYAVWSGRPSDRMPDQIMTCAWDMYMEGRVHLLQRTNAPPPKSNAEFRAFEYIAVGRPPPFTPQPHREHFHLRNRISSMS